MRRYSFNLPGVVTFIAAIAVWELAVRGGVVTFDYLPAPSAIALAFVAILRSGERFTATTHALRSILIGWVLACWIGGVLVVVFGLSCFARRWFLASLEVHQ